MSIKTYRLCRFNRQFAKQILDE